MKIRKGFVSNSSSSSYVCDFCGAVESGWDLCLSEAEMSECEEGHTFCNAHMEEEFTDLNEKKDYLKKYAENDMQDYKKYKKEYEDKIADNSKLTDWDKRELSDNSNYLQDKVSYFEECIKNSKDTIDKLSSIESEDDFEEFDEMFEDAISENGLPRKYCPVCKRLEEMEKDPKYNEYKELYEYFKGVKPNGTV